MNILVDSITNCSGNSTRTVLPSVTDDTLPTPAFTGLFTPFYASCMAWGHHIMTYRPCGTSPNHYHCCQLIQVMGQIKETE
jgi:hypothetical protein